MAKIIKRVGIVFFVLVISFLLILGCVFAVNSATKDKNAEIQNNDGNVQTTAANTYILSGTCAQMAATWNTAVQYSKDNDVEVTVELNGNWIASNNGLYSDFNPSNLSGAGFDNRRICVPVGAKINLDLKNWSIDRNMNGRTFTDGGVIVVKGKLNMFGNYTNVEDLEKLIENNSFVLGQHPMIRGGGSSGYCGAILVLGEFTMRNVIVCGNTAQVGPDYKGYFNCGGIIVATEGGKASIYSGAVSNNYIEDSSDNLPYAAVLAGGAAGGSVYVGGEGLRIMNNRCPGLAGYSSNKIEMSNYVTIKNNIIGSSSQCNLMITRYRSDHRSNVVVYSLNYRGYYSDVGIYDDTGSTFATNYLQYNEGYNPAQFFHMDGDSSNAYLPISDSNGNLAFTTAKYVAKPTAGTNSFVYTGQNITYMPNGFNSTTMKIFYNTRKNAGHYQTSVRLQDGYYWSGTKDWESIYMDYYITRKTISKPTVKANSFVYTGSSQSLQLNNYDSATMNISGNISGIGAKTYNSYVEPNSNHQWSDGTTSQISFTWTITPKPIEKPTANENNLFVYNASAFTYTPNGYVSSQMTISNNRNTNVGKYSAKVTPNSNHKWNDNTSDAINFEYEIIHPGLVVKESSKYEYIYLQSNKKISYNNQKIYHKINDNSFDKCVLGNIKAHTQLSEFLDNFRNDSNLIKIYNQYGTLVYNGIEKRGNVTYDESNILICTGYKVELYSNSTDTTPFDTIYLSVLGDINGDGMINASDVSYLRQVANDSTLLESMSLERQLACMINNKGGITEVDSEILRNYIGKEIDLDKFMESETASTSDAYTYLSLDRDNMLRKTSTSKTNVIGNISVNTSVENLKTKLAEMGINISAMTIYNRKGYEVTDNSAIVGTGWRIEVGGEETYLSVLGDLTGDGRITAADISYLRAIAASDTTNVQDCILLSAILLNKGGITTADSEVLKQAIKGSILLSEYNN